jgi:hypothetical protein
MWFCGLNRQSFDRSQTERIIRQLQLCISYGERENLIYIRFGHTKLARYIASHNPVLADVFCIHHGQEAQQFEVRILFGHDSEQNTHQLSPPPHTMV